MSDKAVLLEEEAQKSELNNPVAPPPYGYSPQYSTNSSIDHHVKVVTAQPGAYIDLPVYYTKPSDNFFILSIVLTVLCCACGSWVAMCCTIPAIIFAVHARDAESRGDHAAMKSKRTTALVLNIVGIVVGLILTIATYVWFYMYYFRFYYYNDEAEDGHDSNGDYDGDHDHDHYSG